MVSFTLRLLLLMMAGMISVGGNGISVRVFCQRFKEITSTEIFLLNIALVNLLLAIASYPAFIVSSFYHQWIFGEIGKSNAGFIFENLN